MDLNFLPNRGNPFCIEVGFFDTMLEIKQKIQKNQGIPVSKQTLVFNGNTLNDEMIIHNSEILDQSHIRLLVAAADQTEFEFSSSPSKIKLLLKMPASKLDITLGANETIAMLKEKIHKMEDIPVNRLVIIANGVELQDDHKSLHECKLTNDSEIDVGVIPASTSSRLLPSPAPSSSLNGTGTEKLRIMVVTDCGAKRFPMEVNFSDTPEDLRTTLKQMKERSELDNVADRFFFIHKQELMEDDRSFRWHNAKQGAKIEVFDGYVTSG